MLVVVPRRTLRPAKASPRVATQLMRQVACYYYHLGLSTHNSKPVDTDGQRWTTGCGPRFSVDTPPPPARSYVHGVLIG